MQRASLLGLAAGLALFAFAGTHLAPEARGQTGEGWITLLDSKTMGDWDRVGESNWRLEDETVVADKRTSKNPAFLISKNSYKNFMLHIEFWASDDANRAYICATATATSSPTEPATKRTSSTSEGSPTAPGR